MSDNEKRIKIAEKCGWKRIPSLYFLDQIVWQSPGGLVNRQDEILSCPNYLNDLNAMHEAEEVLTFDESRRYAQNLYNITAKQTDGKILSASGAWLMLTATARQRADAFLRTIGEEV
jgi:hypothetical protein